MKKIALILSITLTIFIVGCSSNNEFKNISTNRIKNSIESSKLLVEKNVSHDIKEFDYFNDVQEDISDGFLIKSDIRTRLEDIIVIKTDDADKIYSTLDSYKEDMIIRPFGDGYGSENNATIAKNTIVEKKGKYVYLISAKNATEIEKRIINLIKK